MSKYLCFSFILFINIALNAQFLPNFGFENANASQLLDPFLTQNATTNTSPWKVSHGTPQLVTIQVGKPPLIPLEDKKALLLFSAPPKWENGLGSYNCNVGGTQQSACGLGAGDALSEGVFYQYPFKKGKKYTLTFRYQTQNVLQGDAIDKCFVKLVDGLVEPTTGAGPTERCYDFPQSIGTITTGTNGWLGENISLPGLVSICLVPDRNYSQIWFSTQDKSTNVNSNNEPCAPIFLVYDLSLEACEPSYTFTKTETFVPVYGNSYKPIPPRIQSSGSVSFIPGNSIVFKKYSNYVNTWRIDAETYISFLSRDPNTGGTGKIEIEYGTSAEFKIAACDENTVFSNCPEYETWANISSTATNSEPQAFIPNALNPVSQYNQNKVWQPIFAYSAPYNGQKISYAVTDRWGSILKHGEWDDPCNPPPRDFIKWDGTFNGQPMGADVYAYYISVENCQGTKIFSGDITLVYNNAKEEQPHTITEALSPELTKDLDKPETTLPAETNTLNNTEITSTEPQVMIFPNPNNGLVNVRVENWVETYQIQVFGVDGKLLYTENNIATSLYQVDISHLPNGFYFLKVSSPIFNQSFKLSKQ